MCVEACKASLSNSGEVGCPSIFGIITGQYNMALVADDGTRNFIDITLFAADPVGYINSKINEADPSKRIYPITDLIRVVNERGEPVLEDLGNGTSAYVTDGNRTFVGEKLKASARWEKKIRENRCAPNWGVIYITKGNELIGKRIADDNKDVYPIAIQKSTFSTRFFFANDTNNQKVVIGYTLDTDEKDGDLIMIPASVVAPLRLNKVEGLRDVVGTATNPDTTEVTLELSVIDSSVENVPVRGVVQGDVNFWNITDEALVASTGFTEVTPGVYLATFAGQTSGDSMYPIITKDKYDFTAVKSTTFVIP